ncbi:MAG: YqgE/AlgH family protein [Alphaproteobacteria bacterium]|nr:MAG: YqgE/AlgH family protein [Alphaproteobacteria bacterium]
MNGETTPQSLAGKLLVAMPGMGDPRFAHSVVLLCAHGEEGAMGLIVNKPSEVAFSDLLGQLGVPVPEEAKSIRVHFGGPVELGRGFVLHSPEYRLPEGTMAVGEDFAMTATVDILRDIAAGRGPQRMLMMVGYAGWAPGQLEGEIRDNGWLVADASPELVFDLDDASKWDAAVRSLGIDPRLLAADGGSA